MFLLLQYVSSLLGKSGIGILHISSTSMGLKTSANFVFCEKFDVQWWTSNQTYSDQCSCYINLVSICRGAACRTLGMLPQETDEEIRRKYKRLALVLHPDENKSLGAEGAFQLISEACKLLCDKDNRSHYDQRRNYEASKPRFAPANGVPSAPPPSSNGNHNSVKKTTQVKKRKSTNSKVKVGSDGAPSHAKSLSTFWTICLRCNMQYEHPREYLNNNILCRKCRRVPEQQYHSSCIGKTKKEVENLKHFVQVIVGVEPGLATIRYFVL